MKMDPGPPPAGEPVLPDDAGSVAESTSPPPPIFADPSAFREAARALTAALLRRAGVDAFDWVEDAVQDAFAAAARSWPVAGTPREPLAWLHRVAHRRYLDRTRGARRVVDAPVALEMAADPDRGDALGEEVGALDDDVLRLVFVCCHPALSDASRLALTLKCVSQLDVDAIARLLRAEPVAVAQRLVRAKKTLQVHRADFLRPPDSELPSRLDDVLQVIYALFTDGHHAADGDALVHTERCEEALRLVELLASDPATARPEVHALHALVLLTAARLPARLAEGVAVPLAEQDRSRWIRLFISRGLEAFGRSIDGDRVTRYHLEAEIALLHTTAPRWEATPWAQIVDAYDRLVRVVPSPMAQLARVVALAEAGRIDDARSAHAALREVLGEDAEWHAVAGELAARRGDWAGALASFDTALGMALPAPARAHLARRRAECLTASGVAPATHPAHPSPP